LQITSPASTGVYDAAMTSAGHRRPRGRAARSQPVAAADGVPPLAESVGSTIAPADVPEEDELSPLDHDGVVPIAVLTVLWGIGAVVLFFLRGDLADDDRTWWLWTCVAGFGLGLLGFAFTRRRRDALRAKV
jgi:hypothetical protein